MTGWHLGDAGSVRHRLHSERKPSVAEGMISLLDAGSLGQEGGQRCQVLGLLCCRQAGAEPSGKALGEAWLFQSYNYRIVTV